jgi:hypothetical protein
MVGRVALRLFFFLAFTFLLLTSREPPWADAHVVYDTTRSLVERRALDVHLGGPPWFYSYRNGKQYGAFPLGNVVAMVPSYLAWGALAYPKVFPAEPLYALCSHFSPALLMAGAAVLFFRLCRRRGASERLATALTLGLGLSTICFCYARSSYSEALQTFALLLWVQGTLSQGERTTAGGMLALGAYSGILFNTKLVYALVLPLAAAFVIARYVAARRADKPGQPPVAAFALRCGLALLGFLPFLAVAMWHNWLKTGSPFQTGYQIQNGVFSGDLWPALYGYTLSTGKSVFLYSPPLVLGVLGAATALRRHRAETLFLLAVIAVVMVFNAKFRAWHGDYCWGPRYLVPLTPLGLLLALPWLPEALARGGTPGGRRRRQAALGLLLGLGLFVQLLGSAFYWDLYIRILIATKDKTGAAGWFTEQLGHAHYMPQFSPLRGHLWMLSHYLRNDPDLGRDAPWKLLVPQPVDLRAEGRALRLDLWALDFRAGGPAKTRPWVLPLWLGLFAGGCALSAVAVGRRLRQPAKTR